MAIPRSSLTALDGFDDAIDWGALNARAGERVLRVLTGGSLLAIHLTVFGAAFLASFAWSLINHPMDLSSLDGFRVWGVLVALHAVLVGCYQLVARFMGWSEPEVVTDAAPIRRPVHVDERQTEAVWAAAAVAAPKPNAPTRRWSVPSSRRTTRDQSATSGDWPQQPAILSSDDREDVGEVTWPDSAPLSTVLNSSAATASPSDELVSIDPSAGADTTQTWVDGFVESQARPKEQRWSWVEAAAASWLSRRDSTPAGEDDSSDTEDIIMADQVDSPHDDAETPTGA